MSKPVLIIKTLQNQHLLCQLTCTLAFYWMTTRTIVTTALTFNHKNVHLGQDTNETLSSFSFMGKWTAILKYLKVLKRINSKVTLARFKTCHSTPYSFSETGLCGSFSVIKKPPKKIDAEGAYFEEFWKKIRLLLSNPIFVWILDPID